MPELLPDKLEAGTPNLPGIYGLNAALNYLQSDGVDRIRETELSLAARLTRQLACERLRIVGVDDDQKAPIVSVDFTDRDNAEIAYLLDSKCGIMTRCGLHCAPNAHKTLGTYPQGTVRFSVSHFNTADEVDEAADCVHKILERSITDR
jgi:selenocysteine lyase/cysteine desulfurase